MIQKKSDEIAYAVVPAAFFEWFKCKKPGNDQKKVVRNFKELLEIF